MVASPLVLFIAELCSTKMASSHISPPPSAGEKTANANASIATASKMRLPPTRSTINRSNSLPPVPAPALAETAGVIAPLDTPVGVAAGVELSVLSDKFTPRAVSSKAICSPYAHMPLLLHVINAQSQTPPSPSSAY